MTFFTAPVVVTLPGGDWLGRMQEKFEELRASTTDTARVLELAGELECSLEVTIQSNDGWLVEEGDLSFLGYYASTRTLVLLVSYVASNSPAEVKVFDDLFDYDSLEVGHSETHPGYVVVLLDEAGQPVRAMAIQPVDEGEENEWASPLTMPTREFFARLTAQVV